MKIIPVINNFLHRKCFVLCTVLIHSLFVQKPSLTRTSLVRVLTQTNLEYYSALHIFSDVNSLFLCFRGNKANVFLFVSWQVKSDPILHLPHHHQRHPWIRVLYPKWVPSLPQVVALRCLSLDPMLHPRPLARVPRVPHPKDMPLLDRWLTVRVMQSQVQSLRLLAWWNKELGTLRAEDANVVLIFVPQFSFS